MQIAKLYWALIKKKLVSILVIFLVFWIVICMFFRNDLHKDNIKFGETKVPIALVNLDEPSAFNDAIIHYFEKNFSVKYLSESLQGLQEAYLSEKIQYIVTVPNDFSEQIVSNGKGTLLIDGTKDKEQYLLLREKIGLLEEKIYKTWSKSVNEEKLAELIENEEAVQLNITYHSKIGEGKRFLMNYYNLATYITFTIFMLCICFVVSTFYNKDFSIRNRIAPISGKNLSFQLLLCNISFLFIITGILVVSGIILAYPLKIDIQVLLMIINTYVFSICMLAISFVFGIFLKCNRYMDFVVNVVAIFMSFLGGVFVPIEKLDSRCLLVSRAVPSYWYIYTNTFIGHASRVNRQVLMEFLQNEVILLLFAGISFVWGLIISKEA